MSALLGLAHQPNRRSSRRYPVNVEAKIVSDAIWCEIDCTIRNRSERGCKLHLPMAVSLPRRFTLSIPAEAISRPVRLVWRRGPSVGVEFV
ncbi:MAG: PilZ domain-containing protein [Rhizobiales bacterium]|nr:PilZ domain-containing protein [Hyphomicrobiales bacterium]